MACTYNGIQFCLKKKTILTHAPAWMNLKDLMLSEISPTPKDKYGMIHLYEIPSSKNKGGRK